MVVTMILIKVYIKMFVYTFRVQEFNLINFYEAGSCFVAFIVVLSP